MEMSVYRIAVGHGCRVALVLKMNHASFEVVAGAAQGAKDCTEIGLAM